MKQFFKMVLIAGSFLLLLTAKSEAFILSPVADATIFDFEGNNVVDFINHTGFPQASFNNGGESRAVFEFDISSLNNPITSALLDLDVEASQNPFPFTLGIYTAVGDGVITDADYGLGSLFTTYSYSGESNIQIDLTSRLDDHVTANNNFVRVLIRKEDESHVSNSPSFVAFNSLDHPRSALFLVNESSTNAVPEPSTMMLMSSGLAMLFRRKKSV